MISTISQNNFIAIIRFLVAAIVVIAFTILKHVHIIQLNSYNLDQEILWLKKNKSKFLFNIVLLVSSVLFYKLNLTIFLMLVIISMLGLLIENFPRKQKKALAFTKRIDRLIFICVVLFVPFFIPAFKAKDFYVTFYIVLATAISPLLVFLGFVISLPIENAFRKKFMNEAKEVIDKNENIKVVGITGSFGKTSVKYYLDAILKAKYNVCKTPESFNTPMGATLTIKNELRNFDDYFICEMGARRLFDIKEICDIVSPSSCIITDVGNMHLDTFKSIENVRKGKFELLDSVIESKKDGKIAVLNGDNELITKSIKEYKESGKLKGTNVFTYGSSDICDFKILDVKTSVDGSTFKVIYDGKTYTFSTQLLGIHNIKNLTAAIAFSLLSGVNISDIVKEVAKIEAVDHRLKIKMLDGESVIIDDAYNSNPTGARVSADVLSNFDGYIKIMITPGMVELGDKQDKENEEFAKYASSKIDYALVVGKTNRAALKKGFSGLYDKLIEFDKFEEAFNYAILNISGKKAILFENDLSDNY